MMNDELKTTCLSIHHSSFIIPSCYPSRTRENFSAGIFVRRTVNGRTDKVRALRREARGARLRALPERDRAAHRLRDLRPVLERVAPAPEHDHQPLRPRPDEGRRA